MGRKNLDIIKFRGGDPLTGMVDKAPFSVFLNCGSILTNGLASVMESGRWMTSLPEVDRYSH